MTRQEDDKNPAIAPNDKDGGCAKRDYEAPKLVVHGSVSEITKNTGPFGNDGVTGDTFSLPCDRALKTEIAEIDPRAILAKVADLSVSSWRYFSDAEDVRHIGPMAQEFSEAFGFVDTKNIHVVDAIGVALASIQALNGMIEQRDRQIEELRSELRAIQQRLAN